MIREFGTYCSQRRIDMRLTLREFCRQSGIDPSLWSKIERGRMCVPWGLVPLAAKALKIKRGKETQHFKDLANLARGEVPMDILEDKDVVPLLPLFFCGARDPKKLRALAELLKQT